MLRKSTPAAKPFVAVTDRLQCSYYATLSDAVLCGNVLCRDSFIVFSIRRSGAWKAIGRERRRRLPARLIVQAA